ncbi:MAG: ribosomal protein S18-alanine N-acetyltransferase [Oscillospiraceae bacterium]|nr:ribosomal protein S18-alanine N-acetyltransferase [Oscillospiraceae bacterium]
MMKLLPMNASHTAQIAALERECFSDPWSENSIRQELENELSFWLVAEEDGEVVGYVGSQTVLGESDVMNLAVSPNRRRRGIAKALMQALEAHLAQAGSEKLTLEVRASNNAAIALYTRLGFRQIGVRPNYYFHPKEDARILGKELKI